MVFPAGYVAWELRLSSEDHFSVNVQYIFLISYVLFMKNISFSLMSQTL